MRWATFIIIAAVLLTLQASLAPIVQIGSVRPDWLIVGVVFFALYGPPRDGVIAAWVIGFCADLFSVERLGLISISYVLAALGVASVRDYLFRYRATSQFALTFLACLFVQTGWLAYRRAAYEPAGTLWSEGAIVLLTALYTALWAPFADRQLLKVSRLMGISRPRYSHAGLASIEAADV